MGGRAQVASVEGRGTVFLVRVPRGHAHLQPPLVEYAGTTAKQMEGWGWTTVHDPSKLDEVIERWQHSIDTGEPFEMEFRLRGADGLLRWFLTRVRPLRDADAHIVRWFGSNTNIDDRRRNDDFKETFLGVVGHDLRNPLNTILTTSRVLMLREEVSAEIRKKLERVSASGLRMQRMIEQLLDMTRARLGGAFQ
jgi:PAS domain S-box-containing protein